MYNVVPDQELRPMVQARPPIRVMIYSARQPTSGCAGKFLQLELKHTTWLLFSSTGTHRFHNQILARFLAEQSISHRWVTPEQLEYDEGHVTVSGGGRFSVDFAASLIEFWDDSTVFGRFDPGQLISQMRAAGPPWSALRINIRQLSAPGDARPGRQQASGKST